MNRAEAVRVLNEYLSEATEEYPTLDCGCDGYEPWWRIAKCDGGSWASKRHHWLVQVHDAFYFFAPELRDDAPERPADQGGLTAEEFAEWEATRARQRLHNARLLRARLAEGQ